MVGEVRKLLRRFLSFMQNAAHWITGETGRQPDNRFAGTLTNTRRTLGCFDLQLAKTSSQSSCVKLIYRKRPDTTLRTARSTDKPFAASACDIVKCRVHDLDQRLISGGWEMRPHTI